jgi:hypothetical protein
MVWLGIGANPKMAGFTKFTIGNAQERSSNMKYWFLAIMGQ